MIKKNWVGIGRVLLVNAGIILLSAWIGVSLNRAFVAGPQQTTYSYSNETGKFQPVKASEGQSTEVLEEVQLRAVREIISSRSMVPVDGRSEADYENGHLPGAFSLSPADFDKRFPQFSAQPLRKAPTSSTVEAVNAASPGSWLLSFKKRDTTRLSFIRPGTMIGSCPVVQLRRGKDLLSNEASSALTTDLFFSIHARSRVPLCERWKDSRSESVCGEFDCLSDL
jgi:rhodanese-related sulfurtransferase